MLWLQTDPEAMAAAAAIAAAAVLKTAEATRTGFSDPIVIAMIGTQVIMAIGAIASGVALVLNRKDVNHIKEQTKVNTAELLTVSRDTEAIKGHVNSEKTAAQGREETLRHENTLLREMLTEKKLTAQLLAQATAGRTSRATDPVTALAAAGVPIPVEVVNAPLLVESAAAALEGPR